MKEAQFYKNLKDSKVHCHLCNQYCMIENGKRGKCSVRENHDGTLYTLVYGKVIAASVDPIEKKPLYHFLPGSYSYSFATQGCNFHCEFCQNCEISQPGKEVFGKDTSQKEIVEQALINGCKSISYTYTEPTIFYEFAYDTAKLAKEKGLKNVFVTNGYITKDPLKEIQPYLDAANIDLKSFSDDFYKNLVGARLQPVLDSIKLYHELGIHIELTTLIIPGKNDSQTELKDTAEFIASVDKNIPWHVSRFHPDYKMINLSATPAETLMNAVKIGKKAGLKYAYAGNLPGNDYESTYCSKCNTKLIERSSFQVKKINIKGAHCPVCSEKINLVLE
jgi:pyruvate formate lyase activating enzyme